MARLLLGLGVLSVRGAGLQLADVMAVTVYNLSVPKAQVMLQLQGMDYSLFGYNSLKGCPLTSGRDPGFTLPIFSGEFNVTPDFRYSVPRGVLLSHDVSCDTSFTSKVVETPYDLTTLLTGTARLGADKWGPPFSASQHFHKLSAQLTQHVLVVSTAVCSLYDLTLLLSEPPSFHPSFVDWMIKLNNTDNDDKYLEFLDTYGTHFVSRARLGASRTVIYKMDDKVYRLLTEDQVTSAASYSAPELFGYHEDLTSDQQKATAEFRNHETTTFAVGVPLPDGGNSATWLTAAKDNPSVIDYDLTSVEVLFSDTFMCAASPTGGYGIDHDRIKKNIMAVKTKYCRSLKRKDLLVDCRDTGRTLLSTKLIGNTKYGAAESADQCLQECYQLAGCVAVSFCPLCTRDNSGSKCQVFSAGDIHRAVTDRQWQTIMLVDKLETFVKLHNTMVVVNSSSLSDVPPVNSSSLSEVPPVNSSSLSEVPPVTSVQDCYPFCIQDTQCVAFTLTDTSGSLIKCTRHTDSLLSLTQGTGVSVYFVSPLVKRIITSGQTRGLAPSSMLNDWYNSACKKEARLYHSTLHTLTKGRPTRLRVDLGEVNGHRHYAEYTTFRVDGPETNYTLTVSGYSGDAVVLARTSSSSEYDEDQCLKLNKNHPARPSRAVNDSLAEGSVQMVFKKVSPDDHLCETVAPPTTYGELTVTSRVVETPYDLTTLLTGTARLGADKWGPPFSASQHFHKLSAQLTQHVLVVSTAVCSLYDLTLVLTEPPSFHLWFVDWMIKLNNTDDEDKYLEFLDTYGTHFVSRARFGASRTIIYKMDDNVYRLLTEDHVTSAASYSAPELFRYHEDLTSDQQKAIAEFRNHKTTTFAVGAPLPDGGNSAMWLTAAKDNPSVIDYDLTSVEVLFSDTFMGAASPTGGYGIDYDRIKKNIMAVKTKYCRSLKRKDLLADCRDTGRTLLSTKLIGNTKYGAAESADQCLEECYQLAGCVAVSFCPLCTRDNRGSKCQVFSAGDIHRAVTDRQWQTIMLVDKLETFVKLHNTTVVVNSSSLSEVPHVTSVQDCYSSCIQDTQCVAFTLTDTSGSLIKCTRQTDSPLSLTQRAGVTMYFVSPLVKRIITGGQTRGLAPSSMLNDWYKAACIADGREKGSETQKGTERNEREKEREAQTEHNKRERETQRGIERTEKGTERTQREQRERERDRQRERKRNRENTVREREGETVRHREQRERQSAGVVKHLSPLVNVLSTNMVVCHLGSLTALCMSPALNT
ncbi:hypothetical protein C0Q70_12694 [Pomacea canaliculata]|uniref:MACPF domain-containing protein n=1 Tax=Pomacea canaliculata TaxID=400727 RepID=A0A2T7P282_POMCA|nr:hypothetical protein C0Q70_12694 [Pomacea canaliculata]